MWVCIRIADRKPRKLFRSSWIWLHDYKQQMQILLHGAHSQQDRDKGREMLGCSVKKPPQNLACLSPNAQKERGWKAVFTPYCSPCLFSPQKMPKYLSSCCVLTLHWKGTGNTLQLFCKFGFYEKKKGKKKKTEDLCSWVNFHLKLSSAVR